MTDETKSLAVVDGTNLLEVFTTTAKLVTSSDLPSREVIQDFCRAALNMVATDVRMDNIARAIDTMHQTKAIEDYVKAKVKQQHGNIGLSNEVSVTRARQLRELGWWLDENTYKGHEAHSQNGRARSGGNQISQRIPMNLLEKPKFFYDEIGVSGIQAFRWKNIYRIPEGEFEAFVAEFLKDGDTRIEKYFFPYHLITWYYPKDGKDPDEIVIPEEITTKEGQELYLWMREGKDRVTAYIDLIRSVGVGVSEILVIVGLDFWGNIFRTYQSLKKLATPEIEDGDNSKAN